MTEAGTKDHPITIAPITERVRVVWRGRTDPFSVTLGLGSRQDEAIRKRVVETAEKLGTKPAVVALAWVLSKPYVTAPIIGASKPHHLADAVAATELKLDARTIAKLEEPYHSKPVAGHT